MKKLTRILSLLLLASLILVFFFSTAKAPITPLPLTISVSGLGTTVPEPKTYFLGGGEKTVTAIPDSGWKFDHWILDSVNVGSENPYTVVMDTGHSLTAVFLAEFDLTVSVTGSGSTSPAAGTHTYTDGTDVVVTATANSGWVFDHWLFDSANVGAINPYSITMNKDHSLTAVFTEVPLVEYDLVVSVTGSGSTSPEVGTHTYGDGTSVAVTAIADSGWTFDHWMFDSANVGAMNPYTITMNKDHSLTAVFTEGPPEENGDKSFTVKTYDVIVETSTFVIETCSNSSVLGFVFDSSLKRLRFNVEGSLGTIGSCDIAIPSELMSGDFSIYIDDKQLVKNVDYTETNNVTHYLFSIIYEHSTHTIDIISTEAIPEFPAWVILPLALSTIIIGIKYRKKIAIWKSARAKTFLSTLGNRTSFLFL